MKEKVYFLSTKNLGLRSLRLDDALSGEYIDWFNDIKVCQYNSHHIYPYTIDKGKQYILETSERTDIIVLAIEELFSGNHIGNISLQKIDYISRNAEIAFLIGDKKSWCKSYATEAGRVVIQYAFNTLNLHRLYLGTAENNIGMQKVATKLGFTQEGIRKEAIF